jgi:hypothetical protein
MTPIMNLFMNEPMYLIFLGIPPLFLVLKSGLSQFLLKMATPTALIPESLIEMEGRALTLLPSYGKGSGEVELILNGKRKSFTAVQMGWVEIPYGSKVRVTGFDGDLLTVRRIT